MTTSVIPEKRIRLDDCTEDRDLFPLLGRVRHAEYLSGIDALKLTYEDGRSVLVSLVQCDSHQCDRTCMVVSRG